MTRSLSKKIRFDVFKRDGFICQYCGSTPPTVILEVDHIIAICAGGSNHIDNLTTACFDCNRGKGGAPLTSIPKTVQAKTELAKEREEQIKAFKKLNAQIKRRIDRESQAISDIYSESFPDYELSARFKLSSLKIFLEKLPYHDVEEAMRMSCNRINDDYRVIKYFCGICWRKIRGDRV